MATLPNVPKGGRARQDRYDLTRAREPANGRGVPPKSKNIVPGLVAVRDPMERDDPTARIVATVNTRTDLLENERSRRRISEQAYLTGRAIQGLYERLDRLGPGGQWAGKNRVDETERHEDVVWQGWVDARTLLRHRARIARAIGQVGMRFLEAILRDRLTFAAYAAARGLRGEHGVTAVAGRFRMLLEDLAKEPGLAE
jgi:hypothetical protein